MVEHFTENIPMLVRKNPSLIPWAHKVIRKACVYACLGGNVEVFDYILDIMFDIGLIFEYINVFVACRFDHIGIIDAIIYNMCDTRDTQLQVIEFAAKYSKPDTLEHVMNKYMIGECDIGSGMVLDYAADTCNLENVKYLLSWGVVADVWMVQWVMSMGNVEIARLLINSREWDEGVIVDLIQMYVDEYPRLSDLL